MAKSVTCFLLKTEPFIPAHDIDDAVRDAGGLSKEQRRRLHEEAGKNNWGYHELRQRAKELKKGNY